MKNLFIILLCIGMTACGIFEKKEPEERVVYIYEKPNCPTLPELNLPDILFSDLALPLKYLSNDEYTSFVQALTDLNQYESELVDYILLQRSILEVVCK